MKKKLICALLCVAMSVSLLAGCGDSNEGSSETPGGTQTSDQKDDQDNQGGQSDQADAETPAPEESDFPPMNTTDEIELTFMTYNDRAVANLMAEEFTKLYPNITVNIIEEYDDYQQMLLNLVNVGQTPDVFMLAGGCDFALENHMLYDMTELWNADPENENLLPSINGAKLGYYGTDQKWATPVQFFPETIYADLSVFEKLNVTPPPTDWTWDQFIQAIKDTTNEEFGTRGFLNTFVTYYPIAANPNSFGENGFNGHTFDFTDWAVGLNQYAELRNGQYEVPRGSEAQEAWLGGPIWPPESGKLGFWLDKYWTWHGLLSPEVNWVQDRGLKYVPYAIPSVKGNEDGYRFGVLDFGGISSGTQHPREAYELLKFMGWGVEGWKAKLAIYKTNDQDGNPYYRHTMPAPITMDEEIWKDYTTSFFPTMNKPESELTDDDKFYGPYWDAFFEQAKKGAIPYGNTVIPGWDAFHASGGPYDGVTGSVYDGTKNANDWVEELNEKAKECFDQALEKAGLEHATTY